MKRLLRLLFAMLAMIFICNSLSAQSFDKSAFFTVMASSTAEEVDAQLNMLKTATIKEKNGYEGAMMMKKAGFVSGARNKLNLFKSGRKLLEGAISQDGENAELRFLRVMIQENAPRILNYNQELKEDSQYIGKSFKKLSPVVQKAVVDYSKKSKVLNPELL